MELLTKVWPQWKVVRELGEGSFGKVYEIERQDIGGTYKAALKVITIPKSKSEISDILSEGMDMHSATQYFHGMMEEIVKEFAMMEKLKGNTNIVTYEDHEVVPHEEGIGWDILIRMELLTPLTKVMTSKNLTEEDAIKLGIDICKALELCQQYKIIHRDIKPENIFVSELGDYKLGDFGVARTAEKTMSGMSKKGTYTYMAPEVYKGEAYNATVDLYSLGIVLYRLINDYRTPFLPPAPQPILFSDRENAQERRMNGEAFPAPAHGCEGLIRIINKACAYKSSERYANASQMLRDLQALLSGKGLCMGQEIDQDWDKTVAESVVSEPIRIDNDNTVGTKFDSTVVMKEPTDEAEVLDIGVPKPSSEQPVVVSPPSVDDKLLQEYKEELIKKRMECAEAGVSDKNQLVAIILGIFLNTIGAPFIYLGHIKQGLLCLVITFVTMPTGLFLVPIGVILVGWVYALRIGMGEVKDKDGKYVLSKSQKKAWASMEQ